VLSIKPVVTDVVKLFPHIYHNKLELIISSDNHRRIITLNSQNNPYDVDSSCGTLFVGIFMQTRTHTFGQFCVYLFFSELIVFDVL
jgi:hypothetical protein